MNAQQALGMLGNANPWAHTLTGTTSKTSLTSPITYTTSTNTASNSYSTSGAIFNKQ